MNLTSFFRCGSFISIDQQTLLVGFGRRTDLSNPTERAFYFPDFFLSKTTPWHVHENMCTVSIDELDDLLAAVHFSDIQSIEEWTSTPQENFNRVMEGLQNAFQEGSLVKAVPYIRQSANVKMSYFRWIRSLKKLVAAAKQFPIYLYGTWDESSGILGGAPELLFNQQHDVIETMACAGTRKRGADEDLIASDPKELHEHQLVVEDISEALSSLGEVVVGERRVVPFHSLVHLITPIQLFLSKKTAFESVVQAIHPTAALGAIPRKSGWEWLKHLDATHEKRGRYGAPVGFVEREKRVCYVAIRNMQWDVDQIHLFAGCGVVPSSTPEREWNEIQLKLFAIRHLLHL